jgi:hypothetical protein
MSALKFADGNHSHLRQQYEKERLGWDLYYDTLEAVKKGSKNGDDFALDLLVKAKRIVRQCVIRFASA